MCSLPLTPWVLCIQLLTAPAACFSILRTTGSESGERFLFCIVHAAQLALASVSGRGWYSEAERREVPLPPRPQAGGGAPKEGWIGSVCEDKQTATKPSGGNVLIWRLHPQVCNAGRRGFDGHWPSGRCLCFPSLDTIAGPQLPWYLP